MVIGAKTQIFLIMSLGLGLTWIAATLMWPSNLAKLDQKPLPEICNDASCCNAHGCNPPPD
jgi:hypothetical protein